MRFRVWPATISIFLIFFVLFSGAAVAREKVAIVGGGASGLIEAWLLGEQYDVTLIEAQSRLGGHAHTVDVLIGDSHFPIDAGFEFFYSASYPFFTKLLKTLDVPVREFELSSSFYRTDQDYSMRLPPQWGWNLLDWRGWWRVQPLVQFKWVLDAAHSIVDSMDLKTTLEEFVENLAIVDENDYFKNTALYPFFAGVCGLPVEEIKKFVAYPLLKMFVGSSGSWFSLAQGLEIEGGTQAYISKLKQKLDQDRTRVLLSTQISEVHFKENHFEVHHTGGVENYQHLIFATPANQVHALLQNEKEFEGLSQALSKIEYFPTKIAVHGDVRIMPKNPADWGVFNIRSEGTHSQATVYKPWRSSQPVFRSWITYDPEAESRLSPLYQVVEYLHVKQNRAFFDAQQTIQGLQGQNHLWMVGTYTNPDADIHESVVLSAIHIAEKLAPDSLRLRELTHLPSPKGYATTQKTE